MRVIASILPALLAAAGCALDLPAPLPEKISPDWGYNGEDTPIDVYGQYFYPLIEADARSRGEAAVDRAFSVRLRGPVGAEDATERAMPGVTLVDYHHLQATVQDGLDPGVYDLVVMGPEGAVGELPEAFTVTDTRIERLAATADGVVYEVFDTAWFDITLRDAGGERVLQPFDVILSVADEDGSPLDVTFDTSLMAGAVVSEDGSAVEGALDGSGAARLGLSVSEPGIVDVTVSPADASSVVADSVVRLLWESGSELTLEIALPDDSGELVVEAGEVFPITLTVRDQFGNVVDDLGEPVLLIDECQTWYTEVEVRGPTEVAAQLLAATGVAGCEEQFIRSLAGIPAVSAAITVLPAPSERFDVTVYDASIVAGTLTDAFLTPLDPYDNVGTWSGELDALAFTDSVGGVQDASCFGSPSEVFCQVRQVVAGPEVTLQVATDGLTGESNPYAVVASTVETLAVETRSATVAAGASLRVEVALFDEFGNGVEGSEVADVVEITDDFGEVECVLVKTDLGSLDYDCSFSTAVASNQLRALLTTNGADALSAPFEVTNGALAVVAVLPTSAEVDAGEPIDVRLEGADAFGNPYIVQADPVVALDDAGGTLTGGPVTLGADGSATAVVSITGAGSTEVIASQGGVELGRSAPLVVLPGPPVELELTWGVPWAWVGEPAPVTVMAVDSYGNQADVDESVTVGTVSGLATGETVELVAGAAEASLLWGAATWTELATATSASGLTGTSSIGIAAVSDCAVGGPSLTTSFAGRDHAVACWNDATESATILATMSGSSGGSPISWYGLAVGSARPVTAVSSPVTVVVQEPGILDVYGLVVQANGCAVQTTSVAYVAPDDGQPVGPLPLSADVAALTVGLEDATLTVDGATDCAGDPAGGGVVRLRTDRGQILGATSTGTGLQVTLDAAGDASVLLDTAAVLTGGVATVHAWTAGGGAEGLVELQFDGDRLRPEVVSQTPEGSAEGLVDAVELVFTEPIWSASPSMFALSGPDVVGIAAAALVDVDVVQVTFDESVDAGAGTWGLQVRSDIRDVAGNRLDGAWVGVPSDYFGVFGDAPSAATPVDSCEPSVYLFRPDGDDGAGAEADQVTLTMTTGAAPAQWIVSVWDGGGQRVLQERVWGTGSVGTFEWDGRDQSERVVSNGNYAIEVDADDGSGNRGGACTTVVSVDNAFGD